MRILLDGLRRELPGHDVRTVAEMSWSRKKNGELLQLMAADGFEVLLTVDQNILHQQNLQQTGIASLAALISIQPGDTVEIRQ